MPWECESEVRRRRPQSSRTGIGRGSESESDRGSKRSWIGGAKRVPGPPGRWSGEEEEVKGEEKVEGARWTEILQWMKLAFRDAKMLPR